SDLVNTAIHIQVCEEMIAKLEMENTVLRSSFENLKDEVDAKFTVLDAFKKHASSTLNDFIKLNET
ncbi:hypothetical protein CHS0354_004137, partial [Potamilus streckersoni]